jgi:hypothetical protein
MRSIEQLGKIGFDKLPVGDDSLPTRLGEFSGRRSFTLQPAG